MKRTILLATALALLAASPATAHRLGDEPTTARDREMLKRAAPKSAKPRAVASHRNTYEVSKRIAHDVAGAYCWAVFPVDPYSKRCEAYGLASESHNTNEHGILFYDAYARSRCGRLFRFRVRTAYDSHGGSYVYSPYLAANGGCGGITSVRPHAQRSARFGW